MELPEGPVLIKSCHRCSWVESDFDGDEEVALCVHPKRMADPDDTMMLDPLLHTPDDCPISDFIQEALTAALAIPEAIRLRDDDEED